jgi:hypothetical protein
MYIIKIIDEDLYASAYVNKNTNEYLDSIDKAQVFYSENGVKTRFNIEEKKYGIGSCEIREVEIKLK